MTESLHSPESKRVVVRMSSQQRPVIERVRSTGRMGTTDAEVLRQVFLDWVAKKAARIEAVSVIGVERDGMPS